jgi:hypothetical protein
LDIELDIVDGIKIYGEDLELEDLELEDLELEDLELEDLELEDLELEDLELEDDRLEEHIGNGYSPTSNLPPKLSHKDFVTLKIGNMVNSPF